MEDAATPVDPLAGPTPWDVLCVYVCAGMFGVTWHHPHAYIVCELCSCSLLQLIRTLTQPPAFSMRVRWALQVCDWCHLWVPALVVVAVAVGALVAADASSVACCIVLSRVARMPACLLGPRSRTAWTFFTNKELCTVI